MKHINIAELLRDCPKGMELDCTMFDNVTFVGVDTEKEFPIEIKVDSSFKYLTKEGCYHKPNFNPSAKCVIFPKGKTTWEGFQTPFKDGDIAISESGDWIGIVNSLFSGNDCYEVYVVFENFGKYSIIHKDAQVTLSRLATEEEKQKLFQAIKDNGYKWNPETKTLEKLVDEPKFKNGDILVHTQNQRFVMSICHKGITERTIKTHCILWDKNEGLSANMNICCYPGNTRLATEEEKQKLFDALKDNGYKWNPETKTLEKLVDEPKFKDGDILYAVDEGNEFIFILKHIFEHGKVYCYLSLKGDDLRIQEVWLTDYNPTHRLATEEEKQKLFDAIRDNGYKWNPETKTLEKLTIPKFNKLRIPKFKDGDIITCTNSNCTFISIFKEKKTTGTYFTGYCTLMLDKNVLKVGISLSDFRNPRFATEEEKQKLFQAIKDNGYKWNPETKALEKLIEPEFKIEKGKWYVCTKDLLDNYENKAFHKGDIYLSTQDGSLIPSNSNIPYKVKYCADEYFRKWTISDAKDGDILYIRAAFDWICIYKEDKDIKNIYKYAAIRVSPDSTNIVCDKVGLLHKKNILETRLASEEEKQKLFDAIKANGYKWNSNTKTLEKLVEPKFHKGDWIVFNGLILYIKEVVNGFYRTISKGDGIANSYDWDIDNAARLWTIQDAKDGDVLAFKDGTSGILLYKENTESFGVLSYCRIVRNSFIDKEESGWGLTLLSPATKEQRDTLFAKMKETGYKWNPKTKTLEKLVEPKFKVGDRIAKKNGICVPMLITKVGDTCYYSNEVNSVKILSISDQDEYELVPNNFDANTLEKLVDEQKFKDGDVVVAEDGESFQLFLLKHLMHSENTNTDDGDHDGDCYFGWDFQRNALFEKGKWGFNRLASEEEKQKLFQAIKDNGYKWNPETKTLEKLITPKFKVGDRVKHKNSTEQGVILSITDDFYDISVTNNIGTFVPIANQDKWELVPNKFDINTLVPFESRVLVRAADNQFWRPAIWGVKQEDWDFCCVLGGEMWEQCIPYEGNEHLRGVADDCDEYYKYWSIY